MKKVLVLLLAGIMVFTLAACNDKGNDVDDIYADTDEDIFTDTDEDIFTDTDEEDYDDEDYDEFDFDTSEDEVNEITMTYGDDKTKITLYKPEGAFFSVDEEDADDAGDIVIMLADDYSWDAEIMGYKHFKGISSNVPFVEYYFDGAASDNYTFYEQEATALGIDFEGKPVKLIRYTYKEVDDEEEYKECFVGFEYKGTEDSGLFGLRITAFDEELSDSYLSELFTEMFNIER